MTLGVREALKVADIEFRMKRSYLIKLEEKGRICTILFLEIHSSAHSNAE